MEILSPKLDLDSFFDNLSKAQKSVLLLEYDGTLAPFRIERDQAFPYRDVIDLLSAIRQTQKTQIIIISGRAIQDIAPLLNLTPLPELLGSHGWEHLNSNGEYTIESFDEATSKLLFQAKQYINYLGLMSFCEQKPIGLAIHWRGLEPEVVDSIQSKVTKAWEELESRANLKIYDFDGGIELRVPSKNKGTAVESIISNLNLREGSLVAYLGDDNTDEDAFNFGSSVDNMLNQVQSLTGQGINLNLLVLN